MDFTKEFSCLETSVDEGLHNVPVIKKFGDIEIEVDEAPNELIFVESPHYLNLGTELFPAQRAIIRDFFELLCPICNDIYRIRDYDLLQHKILANLQDNSSLSETEQIFYDTVSKEKQILFEYDVCPKCGIKKSDINDKLHNYNELIGVIGQRGGKSVVAACIATAVAHKLLCMPGLQAKYKILKKQSIDISFVAASSAQVAETIYGQFISLVNESPWFTKYKQSLIYLENANHSKGKYYTEKQKELYFKHVNLRIQSLHSNAPALRGRTRVAVFLDELSHIKEGTSDKTADEIYRVFSNSLATVRSAVLRAREQGIFDIPLPIMVCISSPKTQDDKMMRLLKQAEDSNLIFAVHKATWDANPNIKKEDLAEEFEHDPIGAERDFGANPAGAINPFISDPRLIDLCIDVDRPPIITVKDRFFSQNVDKHIFDYITVDLVKFEYKNLHEYVMHCDPGKNKDSFCIAIGHKEYNSLGIVVIIDGAVEVRPLTKGNKFGRPPHQVNFDLFFNFILEINKKLKCKIITYDRWNSAQQVDVLRKHGVSAFGANLDRDDHINFAESVRNGSIRFPAKEHQYMNPKVERNMPCAKAIMELKALNDDGRKVDHLVNGSNDVIQCYIGVHRILQTPEKLDLYKNKLTNNFKNYRNPGGMPMKLIQLRKFR